MAGVIKKLFQPPGFLRSAASRSSVRYSGEAVYERDSVAPDCDNASVGRVSMRAVILVADEVWNADSWLSYRD